MEDKSDDTLRLVVVLGSSLKAKGSCFLTSRSEMNDFRAERDVVLLQIGDGTRKVLILTWLFHVSRRCWRPVPTLLCMHVKQWWSVPVSTLIGCW